MTNDGRTIYTVGHSTRTVEEMTGLLTAFGIRTLVDVRGIPRSRTNPQFNKDVLSKSLAAAGIEYVHLQALGGRRSAAVLSADTAGWTHPAFRSYAQYAFADDFQRGLDDLEEIALRATAAIMCAEAVPWRCHRRIIADYLTLTRAWRVVDVISVGSASVHEATSFAQASGARVLYPGASGAADSGPEELAP